MDRSELGRQLNMKVELIPEGKPNRSGRRIAADFITIHNTSNPNPGADAGAHSRFVRNKGHYVLRSGKKNFVSWHYTVDDKEVIKHLPVNERAIHAGRGNGVSIGIEVCMHRNIDQAAANRRASLLVAALMHDLNIPKSNIKPHKHWTGKACPVLLLSNFDDFCSSADDVCRAIIEPSEAVELPTLAGTESLITSEEELASIKAARETPMESESVETDAAPEEENEHELISEALESFIKTD